jgi:hypothetical protein
MEFDGERVYISTFYDSTFNFQDCRLAIADCRLTIHVISLASFSERRLGYAGEFFSELFYEEIPGN